MHHRWLLPLLHSAAALRYADVAGAPYPVTYDSRSFHIGGTPTLLLSGSVHYQRLTPGMWADVLTKAKENGLNTVQVYVFWNFHEHERGSITFADEADLSAFVQQAADADLWVDLRIGPYVCSEWTWGGLPLWLQDIPGMAVRTNSTAFMREMERWVRRVVAEVRPLLADRGGPIILFQLENEYPPSSDGDYAYVAWVGELAASLKLGVPLVMCNGAADGDHGAVESCNGCDCEGWLEQHYNATPGAAQLRLWGKQADKPAMWTENWMGWNTRWGWARLAMDAKQKAFATAAFLAAGGSYNNYYMWFSGNNYGYFAGPAVTTSYGDEVALHNDGAPHEPLFSHLGRMHRAFASRAATLLCQPRPSKLPLETRRAAQQGGGDGVATRDGDGDGDGVGVV